MLRISPNEFKNTLNTSILPTLARTNKLGKILVPKQLTHPLKLNLRSQTAVAVSGGPDSIALLHLLADYVQDPSNNSRETELLALTIDHGFRAESAQEAEGVKAFAQARGIRHETLPIPWSSPPFPPFPSSSQKTESPARLARLILFQNVLDREQIESIWMGHHRGDQVENLLIWGYGMRAVSRMSGGPVELEENRRGTFEWIHTQRLVVRPLLGFDKSRLVATCKFHQLPYFIDPTNLIPSHTPRNLLRQTLALSQDRHLSHPNLLPASDSTPGPGGPLALLHRVLERSQALRNRSFPAPTHLDTFPLAFQKHSPTFGTVTISPTALPPHLAPSITRSLLREAIEFAAPSNPKTGESAKISSRGLEEAKKRVWEPYLNGAGQPRKEPFTPGGGVLITPLGVGWVVQKQPERQSNVAGAEQLLQARKRDVAKVGDWIQWGHHLWFKLESGTMERSRSYCVEARGRWKTPVVFISSSSRKEEILFDFREWFRGERESRDREKGTWVKDGWLLSWQYVKRK